MLQAYSLVKSSFLFGAGIRGCCAVIQTDIRFQLDNASDCCVCSCKLQHDARVLK